MRRCNSKVLQKSVCEAMRGLMNYRSGVGQEGDHGIENNVSKATKNCAYLIDIIILFQFMNLTSPLLYVYPASYVDPRTDAEHPDGATLLAYRRTG